MTRSEFKVKTIFMLKKAKFVGERLGMKPKPKKSNQTLSNTGHFNG